MRWKQRYKCTSCWYVFQNSGRSRIHVQVLWEEYTKGKQTYKQLSEKYWVSVPTIRKLLDTTRVPIIQGIGKNKEVVVVMDTTYFWRVYGVMVFRDPKFHKNLLRKKVKYETKDLYHQGIKELQAQWWMIKAIICDGRKGVLWTFGNIPMQMCVFHQMKIVRRYITKFPRLEANKELKDIASMLGKIRKNTMKMWLDDRYGKYKEFLEERNESKQLIHTRTLKAYKSIKSNFKYLYTYQDYAGEIDIPKTTNCLEWTFSHLKEKVRLHRWLSPDRREKIIDDYLSQ